MLHSANAKWSQSLYEVTTIAQNVCILSITISYNPMTVLCKSVHLSTNHYTALQSRLQSCAVIDWLKDIIRSLGFLSHRSMIMRHYGKTYICSCSRLSVSFSCLCDLTKYISKQWWCYIFLILIDWTLKQYVYLRSNVTTSRFYPQCALSFDDDDSVMLTQ